MRLSFVILFFGISAVFAYPYEDAGGVLTFEQQNLETYPALASPERVRRQVQLQGGGGGSPGKGFDISVDGRAPVWTSNNGRHSIDATGGYSQHLGGPYGNSRPDIRGGAAYTFRF